FGPFYRRTYSVAGDMVNLAARLAAHAGPGQLVTTPEVVARSRTRFDTTPLAPFQVKGKAQPVEAIVVGDLRRASEPVAVDRLPLIGRDAELATLLAAADQAAIGRGAVVDIVGPAGIGKSRLIEELTARVEARSMWADGDIYGRATPYQPMHRMLRATLGLPPDVEPSIVGASLRDLIAGTAPDLAPLLPLIGIAAGVDLPSTPEVDRLDPEVRRVRLEAVTSDLLGRLLRVPIVMVLNDVHFMDAATIGLARRIAADAPTRPWLIVMTRRPDADSVVEQGPNVTTLELAPLDAAASAELVAAATDAAPLPEHRVRRLAERAGGNPMFLTQLAAASSDVDLDALPDSVEGVVATQIDRLPARRRRWLRAASVLGMTIDPALLHGVLADSDLADETWTGLDEFITMTVDSRLQFTHHLVRLTAYEGLPYRRRVDLHARTARILESTLRSRADEQAALLSLHCLEGARYDAAWTYSRKAGDRARELYAPAEAAECYRRALAAAARLPALSATDISDVLEALAETCMDLGETEAVERALRQARLQAKSDPQRSARLHLATARHRQHVGRHSDALRWISRGRSLLAGDADPTSRRLLTMLAQRGASIRYDQGAYKAALVWARRAIDEARSAGDSVAEAHALALSSLLAAAAGMEVDEASMRHAIELYDRIDDYRGKARAANFFGVCAYFQGNWDAAVSYYAEAERASRHIGRDHDAAAAATNRAEVLVQQGRIDEAEPVVATAGRVLLGARATSFLGFATTVHARVALAHGDYPAAMDRLAEARSLCLEMGETDEALTIDALAAECLLRSGAPVDALSYAEVALAQVSEMGGEVTAEPALHRVLGEALLAGGWTGGEAALRESLACARRRGARNEIERSLDTLLRHGIATDEDEELSWRAESAELAVMLGIVANEATDRVLFQQTDVVRELGSRTTSDRDGAVSR
ncbi:MAG: hypothetical protein QOG80_646, partial [Pseudonocardiales bacterium]|nr:hypothetical protein [Pseudonocardiales bacterium]